MVAALQAHARKSALLATVDVPAELAAVRFDPGVEAAVYFCCVEALRAVEGSAAIHLTARDGMLAFAIDGVAALDGRIETLRDRVEALGGSLDEETPGRVSGHVPARPVGTVE
jgi:hypothetical protein